MMTMMMTMTMCVYRSERVSAQQRALIRRAFHHADDDAEQFDGQKRALIGARCIVVCAACSSR
jgi:hypothetical protein